MLANAGLGEMKFAHPERLPAMTQWATLGVALVTLTGLVTAGIGPELARLMALALAPLVGSELLLTAREGQTTQLVAAASIGCGGAVAAASMGSLVGPIAVLQLAVLIGGAMVLGCAVLRVREHESAARQRELLRLGGIAHDINNLLTVVTGAAELLELRAAEDAQTRKQVARILQAADQAQVLSDELLNSSRTSCEQARPTDLTMATRELTPILSALIRQGGSRAELAIELPDEPVIARVSPSAVEQILFNLVTNARDATRDGRAGRVSVRLRALDPRSLALEVEDDGEGMDPELLRRASEPFFTTKGAGGTGMGLHTVLAVAHRHNGVVHIASQPGAGTCVSVQLPRC